MKFYIYSILLVLSIGCNPFVSTDNSRDNATRVLASISGGTIPAVKFSIKGKLLDPSGSPVQSANLNVSAGSLSTSTSIHKQTIGGTQIVSEKLPEKIQFVDIDPGKGKFGGPVTLNKAGDETNIDYYNLYWANIYKEKVHKIARFKKTGGNFTFVFPLGVVPPEGSSYLLALPESIETGEAKDGTERLVADTQAKFATDDNGEYTMSLEAGSFRVIITSKDGTELGEIALSIEPDAETAPTPRPTSGNYTLTVTSFGPENTTISSKPLLPPTEKASSISFTDTDTTEGKIGGIINIGKASDESNILSYVLYYGKDANTKLGTAIISFDAAGKDLSYTIPAGTSIPTGATHILVFTKNVAGEMDTALNTALNDTLPNTKEITTFSIPSLSANGVISGTNITVNVVYGASKTSLVPNFTHTGNSITVGGVGQVSGTTANDFTNPVSYVVTAKDGSSTSYTVTVAYNANNAPVASSISVSGTYLEGNTLTGTYSFSDSDSHSQTV
ncbi:MAG: hypothetical protein H7A25_20420 [Leptospiraceae bacterium]|nr:hypothetical protein [Leptospiraceae bacterium]MCP5502272.1 hypothetical protein [Leptospiraceae bacterium]